MSKPDEVGVAVATASGMAPVLAVTGLTVRYGNVLAVDNVDLVVPDNGAVALLGVNGAGKTSMLTAISGLTPHQGEVVLDGQALSGRSAQRIARAGIAHVPEGRRLFPNLNVHENLQVSKAAVAGRAKKFVPDDIYELFPALKPLRKRQAWSLSGGEQQMVAIGRALCSSPRILLLDEPTLGLAPVVVDILYDTLTRLKSEVSILLVEQATDLALTICDEGYIMRNGRIALQASTDELRGRDDLMATFVG